MISPDRSVGAASLSVAVAKDEEVAEAVVLAREITEGWGLSQFLAELDPVSEEAVHFLGILGGSGFAGLLESSAKVSCEEMLSGR